MNVKLSRLQEKLAAAEDCLVKEQERSSILQQRCAEGQNDLQQVCSGRKHSSITDVQKETADFV